MVIGVQERNRRPSQRPAGTVAVLPVSRGSSAYTRTGGQAGLLTIAIGGMVASPTYHDTAWTLQVLSSKCAAVVIIGIQTVVCTL